MTTPLDEARRRKALRRRHLTQRQTIIFGSLLVILAALTVAALGVFLNILPAPFDPDFTDHNAEAEEYIDVTPCPAVGAAPVPWADITVNVYNGTSRSGLAATAAQALRGAGLATDVEGNYAEGTYPGGTLITTGTLGVSNAYSIAPLFPGAVIRLDVTQTTDRVSVVVGNEFEAVATDAAQLDPDTPLEGPEECMPHVQLPTPTPTDQTQI